MMNEALLTQNTIVSYTGVSDTEVKHKSKEIYLHVGHCEWGHGARQYRSQQQYRQPL